MNFNLATEDKLRHVLIIGENKNNCTSIIQNLILEDINNNTGAVYITTTKLNVEQLVTRSDNSSNIIVFPIKKGFDIAESVYRIKEINLRALMDNGKVFVVQYDNGIKNIEDIIKLNKLILNNIIEHAFARIDGKEYDQNHDLIDKNLNHLGALKRKPFFIYIEDCEQYLDKELILALMEIRLKKVGMILNLISNGKIDNQDQKIDAILSNSGSVVVLKSRDEDLLTMDLKNKSSFNIKADISKLKNNECVARIMKDGTKGPEIKLDIN